MQEQLHQWSQQRSQILRAECFLLYRLHQHNSHITCQRQAGDGTSPAEQNHPRRADTPTNVCLVSVSFSRNCGVCQLTLLPFWVLGIGSGGVGNGWFFKTLSIQVHFFPTMCRKSFFYLTWRKTPGHTRHTQELENKCCADGADYSLLASWRKGIKTQESL